MFRRLILAGLAASISMLTAQSLPATAAETLDGKKLTFPDDLKGKPAVCVFGFDKDAYGKLKAWLDPLTRDGVNVWTVAHIGGLPLIRDAVRMNLKRGTTQAEQSRMLVMTQDSKGWKDLLHVEQPDRPVVVILDRNGQAFWIEQDAFSKMAYKRVRTQLAKVP